MRMLFTSESVTEGHPDKLCDQISDAVLDAMLEQDPMSRCACEVTATTGLVSIIGEISTTAVIDIPAIARGVVEGVGYTRAKYGFDCDSCAVVTALDKQSPDIAMGVNASMESRAAGLTEDDIEATGAGDQGMMFGFACDETPELMPLPISLAHKLAKRLADVRKDGTLPYLRPDGKTQVTVEYVDGAPKAVDTIIISAQHSPDMPVEQIKADLTRHVINVIIPSGLLTSETKIFVNPTGRFVIGGPQGDSGLTGRKIIVDTYGGYSRHGGGCFSGKDATKVDRSAAYAARYAAKNIVAAGLARKCEIQLAYAIGIARPVSIMVDTFGTGVIPDDKIADIVAANFDMRPAAIIARLGLRKPIFKALAAYGHMGREDLGVAWEKTDMTDTLRAAAGI